MWMVLAALVGIAVTVAGFAASNFTVALVGAGVAVVALVVRRFSRRTQSPYYCPYTGTGRCPRNGSKHCTAC